MRVLVADDDVISRKLVTTHLQKWGHDVMAVDNGTDAEEALRTNPDVRLAVLDWMMPGKDGVEVCASIKQQGGRPFTYVLMLTAKTQKEDLVKALDAGADDYVIKPFDAAELKARLRAGERIINLESNLQSKIVQLEQALAHVRQLQGMIPICAWCKRIRDDEDFWSSVEEYFTQHSEAEFTHGICPECRQKQVSDIKKHRPGPKVELQTV